MTIKNCPCCGQSAVLNCRLVSTKTAYEYNVSCTSCGLSTPWVLVKDVAIRKWNNRKPINKIIGRMEEYVEEASQLGITGFITDMIDAVKETMWDEL